MSPSTLDTILAIIIVFIITVGTVGVLRMKRDIEGVETVRTANHHDGTATYFLEESDCERICEICFGKMGSESICTCECGKSFHESCAMETGACPYCGIGYDRFSVRKSKIAVCRACGEPITTHICKCGTVNPSRNGEFQCVCGAIMHESDRRCDRCSTEYAVMQTNGK